VVKMAKLVKILRSEDSVYEVYPTKKNFMIKVSEYFVNRDKPTISGLSNYLGFPNKKYLKDMIGTEYGDAVEFGISMIEQRHEERLYDAHTSGSSFWLKTQSDWVEQKKEEEDKVVNINFIKQAEIVTESEEEEERLRLIEVAKGLNKGGLTIEVLEKEDDENDND
jgi:hypothetical protein